MDVDRLVLPFAGEAELAPGADVFLWAAFPIGTPAGAFPSAEALGAEDPIELLHAQPRDRVVLVHHDAVPGLPAGHGVGAGRQLDLDRRAVLVALEQLLLGKGNLAADAQIAGPENERWNRRQRGLHLEIEFRVGMKFPERRSPVAAE